MITNCLLFQSMPICDSTKIGKHGSVHAPVHALTGVGILKSDEFLKLQV
jgi:hypothetical protein